MKFFMYSLMAFLLVSINVAAADNQFKIRKRDGGWVGLTKQSDPFDKSKKEVYQIFKGDFTFRCGELNMEARAYRFDSFSFSAKITYVIDDQEPVEKKGRFSTYLGGSDMVTDQRYFSFKLSSQDVAAMKAGTSIKVAGKFSTAGWQSKELSLEGFSSAYDRMCK